MRTPTRRDFLAGSAALVAAGVPSALRAQNQVSKPFRIGVITPAMTGILSAVRTSITDYAGEGARMGAILGEARFGDEARTLGHKLEMAHVNAPSSEAAARAAQRLVEASSICAIIGGVGDGHAEVIGPIAAKARIPFFNVGSPRDALRRAECGRYNFHIEASAAMYLDAMVAWSASQGHRRWFSVYENNDDGRALQARVAKAVAKHGKGGQAVGSAAVTIEQPVYYNEINAGVKAGADAFLLLISAVDQFTFIGNKENLAQTLPTILYPDPIAQTRDYVAAGRVLVPETIHRIQNWETTKRTQGADLVNDTFYNRWGAPTDPTGWASFSAVKIMFEAFKATKSLDSATIVSYLESPAAVFDLGKGPGTSFRPWDHQLRQPIYVIKVDHEVEWVRSEIATWIKIANYESEWPVNPAQGDAIARLDQFGDMRADSGCRL